MQINTRIKELREQKCMTQAELANASGVGRITISRIETGELQNMTLMTVKKLAKGLGVEEEDLFIG